MLFEIEDAADILAYQQYELRLNKLEVLVARSRLAIEKWRVYLIVDDVKLRRETANIDYEVAVKFAINLAKKLAEWVITGDKIRIFVEKHESDFLEPVYIDDDDGLMFLILS